MIMPHPKKKQKLAGGDANCSAETAAADQMAASANDLSIDVLADIFGFLDGAKDIMQKRRVCKKWKEAVKKTIVPPNKFSVRGMNEYNAMRVMATEMPNLQRIAICHPGVYHKYSDGEDPDEEMAAETTDWTSLNIEIISNFSKLRILEMYSAQLNGRYPFLFNSFPMLQRFSIQYCGPLKFDLEMLARFPLLKELDCCCADDLTGNISSLRVLKETLEKVTIYGCSHVVGNLKDLADFPHLKALILNETNVTGDIRDIGGNDFLALECLILPKTVYGGMGYEFQRISEANDLVRTMYLLKKRRPTLEILKEWRGMLSETSPDWYESAAYGLYDEPPFSIQFVKAGSRIGYRWATCNGYPCEVNWLDSEPDTDSSDFAKYIGGLARINRQMRVNVYRGFHEPPTEEEYLRLVEEYEHADESDEESESDS